MSDERYQKVKDVFYRVWSVDPEHRTEVLDHACNGDVELRREVVKLLDANRRNPGFLHQPLMDGERFRREAEASLVSNAAGAELPQRIGRYRVIRLIGEGGMGTVYEAEQENPKRRVALKVIRPTLSSRSLMQRFDHEVKILGRLQHPGIAQ